jgi:uncharacterized spore protein YtfJ
MAKEKPSNTKAVERTGVAAWQSALARFDSFLEMAGHKSVFAEPIEAEGSTVIGTAETIMGWGGGGGGSFKMGESPVAVDSEDPEVDARPPGDDFGGGAGGGAYTRPVAVIVIDGDGVRVEPVVDATKIALAAITAFGSMFFMFARMWRAYLDLREKG